MKVDRKTKPKLLFLTILFFALFGWGHFASAAPALVGYGTNDPNANGLYGTTDFTYTVQHNGALLVVAASLSDTLTTTVTSPGETWTLDTHAASSFGDSVDIHSAVNVSAGTKNIHVASTSTRAIRVVVAEFSGMATTAPAAHRASSSSGVSGSINAGSVTTTIDNCILFAAARTDTDAQGWGVGPGYTFIDTPNAEKEPDQKLGVEYRGPVAAGAYSGTMTISSDIWAAGLVAYKPATSSDATPPAAPSGLSVN